MVNSVFRSAPIDYLLDAVRDPGVFLLNKPHSSIYSLLWESEDPTLKVRGGLSQIIFFHMFLLNASQLPMNIPVYS